MYICIHMYTHMYIHIHTYTYIYVYIYICIHTHSKVALVKNSPVNAGDIRHRFDPLFRKIPWRKAWQPTPVFLSGESHGQRATVHRVTELDTTEATWHAHNIYNIYTIYYIYTHTHTHTYIYILYTHTHTHTHTHIYIYIYILFFLQGGWFKGSDEWEGILSS